MDKEFSAGGVVSKGNELLLVQVESLKGELVWTFPKGHPEPDEAPESTALREVREETGWECSIRCELMTVNYKFSRQGRLVDKKVQWFWMEPKKKVGKHDAVEIRAVKWAASDMAFDLLKYPSDLELLACWKKCAFTKKADKGKR